MTKKVVETDKDLRFEVPLYTPAEAAHAVDVPPSTFATWAKGLHPPPARTGHTGPSRDYRI